MDLRQLRHFIAVAEEGHVTRAAEQLGMQQPPLSQSIQALERDLGVRLFRRLPRGMALTEPGQALLAEARAIVLQLEHARAATQRTARGELGRIAVGFTSSAPFHPFVPRCIRAFRESHRLVSLTLEEGGTAELIKALRGETLDAAFIRTAIVDPSGLSVLPLLSEPMVAALPAAHPLARGRKPLPLARFGNETFIVYRRPSGPGLYDAIIAACHASGFSPQIGQEAPRIVATLNLVAAGLGISIVPASFQRMALDGVVYRPLSGPFLPVAPLLLAARRNDASAVTRQFTSLIRGMVPNDSDIATTAMR